MAKPPSGADVQEIGVPYDSAGHDRQMALYDAITKGDHDPDLGRIEQMAKSRRRYDNQVHPKAPVPAGIDQAHVVVQIQHGYFSAGYNGMDLLLEAVRNRRITLRNAKLIEDKERLAAEALDPKDLAVDDPVRVRPDATIVKRGEILLGKTGRVKRVLQRNVVVVFDDGQALGAHAGPGGVKLPVEFLERYTPEAGGMALSAEEARTLAELVGLEQERLLREYGDRDSTEEAEAENTYDLLEDLRHRLVSHASQ